MTDSDSLEARFARSTRRRKRMVPIVVGAVAFTPFAYLGWRCHSTNAKNEAARRAWDEEEAKREAAEEAYRNRPLLPDELAELRALAPRAKADLEDLRARWREAVTPDALADAEPGAAACPVRLAAPTLDAAASYVEHGSIDVNYFGRLRFDIYKADAPIPEPDLREEFIERERIAARVAAGRTERPDLERLRNSSGLFDRTFIVATEHSEPVAVDDSYFPGSVRGRGYIYRDGMICAGTIDVVSSSAVKVRYVQSSIDLMHIPHDAAKATLARDLEVRIKRALASSMRAIRE